MGLVTGAFTDAFAKAMSAVLSFQTLVAKRITMIAKSACLVLLLACIQIAPQFCTSLINGFLAALVHLVSMACLTRLNWLFLTVFIV